MEENIFMVVTPAVGDHEGQNCTSTLQLLCNLLFFFFNNMSLKSFCGSNILYSFQIFFFMTLLYFIHSMKMAYNIESFLYLGKFQLGSI